MNAMPLSAEVEAWARAEVAAGHAESVEALTAEALAQLHRQQQALQARA